MSFLRSSSNTRKLPRLSMTTNKSDMKRVNLAQGSYRFSKNRLTLSYGETKDDANAAVATGAYYETRSIALFCDINDKLKLVAEYNQFEIDGHKGSSSAN